MSSGSKESLFSQKNRKALTVPFVAINPITVQVLGICSALAVTSQLKPSLVMGAGVTVVMAVSSVVISLMRNLIPSKVRIIVEMTVVATMVVLVDQFLAAFAYDVSKQLSIFVGLIITNCIVLGRLEAYALGNPAWPSFLDALGNGIGYSLILAIVGTFRELAGSGTLMGYQVIPQQAYTLGYVNNGLLILPAGAFIILALIIWVQRTITGYRE